jgi:hypothetical protein
MTELFTLRLPSSSEGQRERPLAVNAALAGLGAAGTGLSLCWLVALVGWFASDGGAHGESTAALKVGAGAWLLGHGTDLHLDTAVVTAVPLGLTALLAWMLYRTSRWAGASAEVEDLRALGLATVVLSGTYGSVALAVAVVATTQRAAPDPFSAFLGGVLLAAVAGGTGLVAGSRLRAELRALVPGHLRAVVFGGLVGVLALWSAGALLSGVTVLLRGEPVANVLARLHLDLAGGFFSVLLVALIAPNLATWGSAYLLGGGFALGTDTVVAPSEVVVGPLPAVPVLAAVPASGPGPSWAMLVLLVPVSCGLLVGWAVSRRFPNASVAVVLLRAGGAAVAAATALTLLAAWSGGAVGGGRMSDLGPDLSTYLLTALAGLVPAATAAGAAHLWWQRRHGRLEDVVDADLTLERRLPWRDAEAAANRSARREAHRLQLQQLQQRFRRGRWGRRRRRRAPDEVVPPWARLGVWGAATPAPEPPEAPASGGRTSAPPPRDEDRADDEHTTFLSR